MGAVRVYRTLLRLLPDSLRDERGPEMEALFLEMWRARRDRLWDRVRFWMWTLYDLASQGLAARWEHTRGAWVGAIKTVREDGMSNGIRDLRTALRQFKRKPLQALSIVLLMTVGIGGNVAAFQVFHALFLDPLPFPEDDRLVDLDVTAPSWGLEYVHVAYPDFHAWRELNTTFESMALYDTGGGNMAGDGLPERVPILIVSHGMDDVLGLSPVAGRFYTAEEDVGDGPPVGMISSGLWQRRFGNDPDAIGSSMTVNGFTFEVVGVLPPEAQYLTEADVWFPVQRDATSGESNYTYRAIGRLRQDTSLEAARADLLTIHRNRLPGTPQSEATTPVLDLVRERYLGRYRLGTEFTFFAVGGVLLLACINILGLALASALSRSGEFAVKLALGASRGRLVQGMLTESALLGAAGAILGTVMGVWGSRAVASGLEGQLAPWVTLDFSAPVFVFVALTTIAAVALSGLVPALYSIRSVPSHGFRGATAGRARLRALGLVTSLQVALSLAMLVIGGTIVDDFRRLASTDPGVAPEGLATFQLSMSGSSVQSSDERVEFAYALEERLTALEGVTSATLASTLPLVDEWGWSLEVDGPSPLAGLENTPIVQHTVVSPGYFDAMGIPLLRGRGFHPMDGREEGGRVAIVSQSLAETHLGPGAEAVGRRIRPRGNTDWMEIVGLVPDVFHNGVDSHAALGLYQPITQLPLANPWGAVRTRDGETLPAARIREVIGALAPDVTVFEFSTMEAIFERDIWVRKATAWVLAGFALVALFLTTVGLYASVSFIVGQRTREIGVRKALGAKGAQIQAGIVGQVLRVVGLGALTGLILSRVAMPALAGLLTHIEGAPVAIWLAVPLGLMVVGALAGLLPARRAAAVEATTALRPE